MEENFFSSTYPPFFEKVVLTNDKCHLFPNKGWLSYKKARLFGNKAGVLKNTLRVFPITPKVLKITPKVKFDGRSMEEKKFSSISK